MKQGVIYEAGKMGLRYAEDYKPNFTNKSIIMNTISVNRNDLIKVLTENKDKHQTEYSEAYEGYKLMAIDALKAKLELVEDGKKFTMYFNELNAEPESHVRDYQNVIDMLGVTDDAVVQITMDDYLKYYKNQWSWHSGWSLSNKAYVDTYYNSTIREKE